VSTKRILQIAGIAILVLAVVFGAVYAVRFASNRGAEQGDESQQRETSGDIPEGTEVPEEGAVPEDESVAVPVSVQEAAKGAGEAQLRTFLITAEGGKFTPSTVIVYKNDTIHINFTAKDGEYDITVPDYSLKQTVRSGETKPLEFRAEKEGKYAYYCESCGGMDSEAKGSIIVMPQP